MHLRLRTLPRLTPPLWPLLPRILRSTLYLLRLLQHTPVLRITWRRLRLLLLLRLQLTLVCLKLRPPPLLDTYPTNRSSPLTFSQRWLITPSHQLRRSNLVTWFLLRRSTPHLDLESRDSQFAMRRLELPSRLTSSRVMVRRITLIRRRRQMCLPTRWRRPRSWRRMLLLRPLLIRMVCFLPRSLGTLNPWPRLSVVMLITHLQLQFRITPLLSRNRTCLPPHPRRQRRRMPPQPLMQWSPMTMSKSCLPIISWLQVTTQTRQSHPPQLPLTSQASLTENRMIDL